MSARSLRIRLLVTIAVVLVAVIASIGIYSSVAAKRQFDRFLLARNDEAAKLLQTRGLEAAPEAYARYGVRTIVVGTDGAVTSYPATDLAVTRHPDGITLTRGRERLVLRAHLRLPNGASVYVVPATLPGRRAFGGGLDRWLLIGLGVVTVGALVLLTLLLRRIFAPVEALTTSVRALAGGKLDARVAVRGDDEIGELARSFNAMAEALERNERARRHMVSDIAHELRTPLTNIRMQLEAAQDGVVAVDAALLASLTEDAEALARLVDDLQQLALAEAGALRLELEECNVRDLVTRAVAPHPVEVDVDETLIMRVDRARITQVVRILVNNALTHARSRVRITASAGEVLVSDDGEGVPAGHEERIFDRFHRADASRSRITGGSGLGLAIARELVALHGGTLRLENDPGRGATFIFTIPS
ncbi:MAG TPA: ATP-binding protein [Thermoanaerobaculia bacterium]